MIETRFKNHNNHDSHENLRSVLFVLTAFA
jgi:hypothetical protein